MEQQVTSSTLREDLGPGSSVVIPKPTRKTSSFEREGWWRVALRNTPNPGTYHLKTFIEESLLNPVIATYSFKNEGRKKPPPLVQINDPVLNDLPLYVPPDFLDLLRKQGATYSFKDKPRPSPSMLVYKDQKHGSNDLNGKFLSISLKSICKGLPNNLKSAKSVPEFPYNEQDKKMVTLAQSVANESVTMWLQHLHQRSVKLSPGQYDLRPAPVPKHASRSFVFRSAVQRFPTSYFIPHEGPGPGHYDLKIPQANSVTSCFQSRVPRFLSIRSKTPGPGAYTSSAQSPKQSPTIAKMGREHSLFFNNTIGF